MKNLSSHSMSVNTLVMVGVIALALWLGVFFPKGNAQYATFSPTPTPAGPANIPVSYQGEDGRTALALLQEHAESEVSGTGDAAIVTTINGHKPDIAIERWNLYINGQKTDQSPATLITKSSDSLEWRLEPVTP